MFAKMGSPQAAAKPKAKSRGLAPAKRRRVSGTGNEHSEDGESSIAQTVNQLKKLAIVHDKAAREAEAVAETVIKLPPDHAGIEYMQKALSAWQDSRAESGSG